MNWKDKIIFRRLGKLLGSPPSKTKVNPNIITYQGSCLNSKSLEKDVAYAGTWDFDSKIATMSTKGIFTMILYQSLDEGINVKDLIPPESK